MDDNNFIVFISIAYYIIWTIICVSLSILWLGKEDAIAVAYCVPAKTPAMGFPLLNVMFQGLPAITASENSDSDRDLQIAGGILMTIAFRRWIRTDEERKKDAAKAAEEGSSETNSATGIEGAQ